MAKEHISIINAELNLGLGKGKTLRCLLSDYESIYAFLKNNKKTTKQTLHIFDVTHTEKSTNNDILEVNDHINRIGANPFIGNQAKYKIDFINVEHLYEKTNRGVITNSLGPEYNKYKNKVQHPSTYLANISALGKICKYKIKAYLVNQNQ